MKNIFVAASLALLLPASAVRATPPALPEPSPLTFHPPKGERVTLSNGITVFLLEDHDLPLIQGEALVRSGLFYGDPKNYALAQLTGDTMRSGGSARYDADAMNEALEYLGASVETGMGQESGSASFSCLARDLDAVLPIFADVLAHPDFRADKVEVEKQSLLESLRRRNDEPGEIARREARRALFGPAHPYGKRLEAADVSAVSRRDLLAFHRRFYKPRAVTLALSGDFRAADMRARLEKAFGAWKDEAPEPLPTVPAPAGGPRRVILVAKDDVTQTAFRVVETGMPRHDPDHFAFEVADGVLGGGFVSRLVREIRSRRGLAYMIGSFFVEWRDYGYQAVVCGTRNEKAVEAMRAALEQVRSLREKAPTPEELAVAKNSIINSFVFHFQTPAQIVSQRAALEFDGFPDNYLDGYLDHIRGVTREKAQAVARKRLDPDKSVLMVVGPSSLEKELSALGPVEVRKPD